MTRHPCLQFWLRRARKLGSLAFVCMRKHVRFIEIKIFPFPKDRKNEGQCSGITGIYYDALFYESPFPEFFEGQVKFLLGIHNNGASPGDRLAKGFS